MVACMDEMSTTLAPQSVRDGNRILRFLGRRVAEASSARPGVQRWSELIAYETTSGSWICQRIGHSTVAHRPECPHVNHRMPSWLEAKEESKVRRTQCPECQPVVGDGMDPHTRLEAQRYTIISAESAAVLCDLLAEGRDKPPPVVARLIEEIRYRT